MDTTGKRVLSSAILALLVMLLIAALQFYGVVSALIGKVCLILIWLIGVIAVLSSARVHRLGWRGKVLTLIASAIPFAVCLIWLNAWATRHGQPIQQVVAPSLKPPSVPPREIQPNPTPSDIPVRKPKVDKRPTIQKSFQPEKREPSPPSDHAAQPSSVTPIELSASIVDPTTPAIVIENSGDDLAENVTWELVMYRRSDFSFFSFATQNIGYIKAHSRSPNELMNLDAIPMAPNGDKHIKQGDQFVGTIGIDCPLCKGASLVVEFTWGIDGWYFQINSPHGGLVLPKGNTPAAVAQYFAMIDSDVSADQRRMILQ